MFAGCLGVFMLQRFRVAFECCMVKHNLMYFLSFTTSSATTATLLKHSEGFFPLTLSEGAFPLSCQTPDHLGPEQHP
jgi:hypothetical protein